VGNVREPACKEAAKPAGAPDLKPASPVRMIALQRAIGNAAMGRLLRSRLLTRDTPKLQPDEPVEIERGFELGPMLHAMNASAEREFDQPSTPRDFSSDPSSEHLANRLQPGDHVWYWSGRVSTDFALPRTTWWPDSPGPLEFHHPGEAGHGREIYNFVIRADRVMCGQPHMNNPFGSFAWLNNNPGNLSGVGGGTQGIGEILDGSGHSQLNGSPPDTPLFLVFPTYQAGLDAIPLWLARNGPPYTSQTIQQAWQKYDAADAPKYTRLIEAALGLPAATTVLNTLTPAQWDTLKETIRKAEGTIAGWTYNRGDRRLPAAIREAS
jgi:hypothetical protein